MKGSVKYIFFVTIFTVCVNALLAQIHTCDDINSPTFNSSLYQGVYFKELTWEKGKTITVSFLNGNTYVQEKVKVYAKEWSQYANLKFAFVENRNADIRISFYDGLGSWSLIGKESSLFSVDLRSGNAVNGRNGPSMNFGWFDYNTSEEEFRRTILHEFGHALGLLHEHKNPNAGIKWNKPKVYAYYMQTRNWTREQVDKNILGVYSVTQTNQDYDPESIMHYPISNDFTLNNYEVGWNTQISSGDKRVVAKLYPFSSTNTQIKHRITNLSYGDGVWALATSKKNKNYAQVWRTRTYFPKQEISELWDEAYDITNLSYGDGVWALVMSKGTGYSTQAWRTRSNFPKQEISELWDEGYDITDLSYGNGVWALVMSKGTGYSTQAWRTRSNFPKQEISELWDEGYDITHLTYGNGVWALVMSKGTGYRTQAWRTRTYFPKEEIAELWDEGYDITSLTYGNGIWALVMSKGTGYSSQAWRTRTYFPQEEIAQLWNE